MQESSERFLAKKISFLLWREETEGEERFLGKFVGRSYLHCKWFTAEELMAYNFEVNSAIRKGMHCRMRKTTSLKLQQSHCFNPSYTEVDRILSSAEEVTAINHKLANDIKGHWSESMYLVCSKLLNFMKHGYPYGLHFPHAID
jgi:hypothetical protein